MRETVPEQYRAVYDDKTGSIWILDCWHKSIENLSPENFNATTLDPNSPAVTILNRSQVNALIEVTIKQGWLDKIINSKLQNPEVPIVPVANRPVPETIQSSAIKAVVDVMNIPQADERTRQEALAIIKELAK